MTNHRQKLGQQGETLAGQYLRAQGYKILATNFRTRFGEVDLIAEKEGEIVFVEVKTRKSKTFGSSLESLSEIKLQRLIKVALAYIHEYNLSGRIRIDLIGIDWNTRSGPKIHHLKNVLS